jgi:hypothetical protein
MRDVEPAVVRVIDVPAGVTLGELHGLLQAALGWTDSHLHQFTADGMHYGVPDPDWDDLEVQDEAKARLGDLPARFEYLYDFGDGWEHTIKVERIAAADPRRTYPVLIEAAGRCPPEDVGGPPGYEEFLAALADPAHESHADMLEWCPDGFDPQAVDPVRIEQALQKTAARWTRKPKEKSP